MIEIGAADTLGVDMEEEKIEEMLTRIIRREIAAAIEGGLIKAGPKSPAARMKAYRSRAKDGKKVIHRQSAVLASDEKRNNPTKRFTPDDRDLASWMHDQIVAIVPGARPPSFACWANDIRLMRERDGRTIEDIRGLFKFANSDTFWRTNILSPKKLREKWTQLEARRLVPTGHSASWWQSERATQAKAGELGVMARAGESWAALRERISAALGKS